MMEKMTIVIYLLPCLSKHLIIPLSTSPCHPPSTSFQGVLCVMPSDRHVRRAPAEWLREHPLMQHWLLRVAGAEALSSTRDGQLSGNIPLLVRACENCLHGGQVVEGGRPKATLHSLTICLTYYNISLCQHTFSSHY